MEDADLALSATPQGGLETRHRLQALHRDTFAVLFDPAMIGTAGPLDLETYLALPHLLLSPAGHLHGPLDERLAEMGRTRTVLAALSHFHTMPFLLKRRRAIVNMPSIAAGDYAAAYGLAVCPLPLASPDFEVALIWHVRTDGVCRRWIIPCSDIDSVSLRGPALRRRPGTAVVCQPGGAAGLAD